MDEDTRQTLTQIYNAAVAAADPYRCVRDNLAIGAGVLYAGGARYPLADIENIYVIGAGKAAYRMAAAAEDALGELITGGMAVTKDGHGGRLSRIRMTEASHPVPDARGESAARAALELAGSAGASDLLLCLLSGGASALLALPAPGLTLEDKQATTRLLLSCGADIGEVNTVRKHLSHIKGGRLARAAQPAWVASLIVSDVIGDDLSVIASGPTAPDESTYSQAVDILKMRGVYDRVPPAVRRHLEEGDAGSLEETPGPGDPAFANLSNTIVTSNSAALAKAEELAGYLGYAARVIGSRVSGEARAAAQWAAGEARACRASGGELPACLVMGGETTVTIAGSGKGGRNQEEALAFAISVDGEPGVSALFAGTDGTDGPTDAAGAFVDGATVREAASSGLDAAAYLDDNDSYTFFSRTGGLFTPGPTGTNVMDLGIILIR